MPPNIKNQSQSVTRTKERYLFRKDLLPMSAADLRGFSAEAEGAVFPKGTHALTSIPKAGALLVRCKQMAQLWQVEAVRCARLLQPNRGQCGLCRHSSGCASPTSTDSSTGCAHHFHAQSCLALRLIAGQLQSAVLKIRCTSWHEQLGLLGSHLVMSGYWHLAIGILES